MTEKRSSAEGSVVETFAGGELEQVVVEASKQPGLEPFWKDGRSPDPARRCTARRSNGEPCRRIAIRGGTVCPTHGGSTGHVKAKARVRLEMAADRMAKELLGIATDNDAPAAVKLAAIRDALDRAGLSAKTAVSVEVGPTKEYEEILTEAMTGGSRAESRAARGVADEETPDWLAEELAEAAAVDDDVIDAEVVEAPQPPAPAQASGGLMRYEDALALLRHTSPPPAPQARRRGRR
ncbi:hypothetical protein GS479_19345 [Rhodococcus hoagii]|nr:hypothetical protein [Prescottella equi]